MKRLCGKLATEVKAVAGELARKIGNLPDDVNPAGLEAAELALRDALANLRRVRNGLGFATGDPRPTLESMQ